MYHEPSISARWLNVKQPLFSENHEKIVGSKSVTVKDRMALSHPVGEHRLAKLGENHSTLRIKIPLVFAWLLIT